MTAPSPAQALLTLDGVEVGYGRALWPALDLGLRPGELWALVGRNGSGKSTLLRSLLGVQRPLSGRVQRHPEARLAYVPQRGDYDLSVPARVIDFLRHGADRGWSFVRPGYLAQQREAVQEALLVTDLGPLLHRPMQALSEGQKQRVLIARALVGRPNLLVLDEPTSAMDVVAERSIFGLLRRLTQEHGVAILMASHQLRFVPEYATHAVMLDADAGLRLAGPMQEVLASETFREAWGGALS